MIILGLVVVVSAVVSINIQRQAAKPAPYVNPYETLVGVALSPKSYKGEKFTSFFDKAKEIGNAVSWSGPWQDFAKSNGTPSDIATLAKQKGFMPIYLTGPTIEEVKNGDYQTAMTAAIGKFAATEQPKYIGIGHEIDQLYLSSPELLKKYLKAAKPVVGRLRSTSASVKIFATIQYERSQGLRGGLFGGTNDESKSILKKVLPQLEMFDFVAFTTYPGLIYKTPEDLPDDYYSKVTSLTSKPIIFTEVGWSRSAPEEGYDGSESAQAEFIKEFRHQMEDIKPVLQLWSFLYPQKVSSVFETMSLLATDQETSPGFEAWKRK
ncbi:hypothetical protein A2807_00190 [Candidatus Berkelbacteria bacterium RIFCSPHIGHO2_01_FULL_50_36]|nr:MAG: hypothetical protein A2807_00190 [Candidatus Berkelbacteria bacterium RIFCSPHIGHO2_01_FULL_50_36]